MLGEDEELAEFRSGERMKCQCGCGEIDLDRRLIHALNQLRRLAKLRGHEIEIIAGYRCENSDGRNRGVSKTAHRDGRAADIRIPGLDIDEMYKLAVEVPEFAEGGIGIHDDGTIHVDVRVFPARWGRVNGAYVGIATSKLLGRHHGETESDGG